MLINSKRIKSSRMRKKMRESERDKKRSIVQDERKKNEKRTKKK